MSAQYAVLHTEKGSISSGGIGNHIDRTKGAEHTYPHANPNKTYLNIYAHLPNKRHLMPLYLAIDDRIKEGYNARNKAGELKAIRKDSVKYCTHILTGSHELMTEIGNDEEKLNKWLNANFKFMMDEFGEENIVRFVLHMDEKTPHIHCVTIPLTSDGRLSAKEIIGNRKQMQERQDRYAEAMKPFGFIRGIKNTGIKHENAREYYNRVHRANDDESKKLEVYEEKRTLSSGFKPQKTLNKDKTLLNYQEEIKRLKTALNEEIGNKNKIRRDIQHLQQLQYEAKNAEIMIHHFNRARERAEEIKKMNEELFNDTEKRLDEVYAREQAVAEREVLQQEINRLQRIEDETKKIHQWETLTPYGIGYVLDENESKVRQDLQSHYLKRLGSFIERNFNADWNYLDDAIKDFAKQEEKEEFPMLRKDYLVGFLRKMVDDNTEFFKKAIEVRRENYIKWQEEQDETRRKGRGFRF